jgi:hypothetical protein
MSPRPSTFCNVSISRAQDCKCPGSPIGAPYVGGNGQPLKWVYEPRVINSPLPPRQKLLCYFKQVSNRGTADVRDVRWEVANFFRRIVPKGTDPSSCPEVAGDTKPAPTNGPLYYGPSTDAYDTTVLQPKDGWGDSASNGTTGVGGKEVVWAEDGKLNAAFTFFADDSEGKPVPARLILGSSAKSDGSKNYFGYFVMNDSTVPLAVLVNLSAASAVLEKVPMLQRMLWLKPGDKQGFDVVAEGPRSIERATIVVYDQNKNVTALDSAAFYTVAGKKEVPDESFWKGLNGPR